MRIMITGGTGFIGYHTTLALLDSGHDVCLMVRSVDKMRTLFGERIKHFVVGDITDAASVAQALDQCDAVIHTAAMVSTDANNADQVFETNLQGTKLVVGGAIERGLGPVIHVSSITALYNSTAKRLDENSPLGNANTAYGRSKVACEKYVRTLQDDGAPIYITYPASVIGPNDPGLTEPHQGLIMYLGSMAVTMPGGMQYVDVRDVADVHCRLIDSKLPPGRYALGGHFLSWRELIKRIKKLTDRRIAAIPIPGLAMRNIGRIADLIGRYQPLNVPINYEAMMYATKWVKLDNTKVERDLNFSFRDIDDSLSEAIRWLHRERHINNQQAGSLAN